MPTTTLVLIVVAVLAALNVVLCGVLWNMAGRVVALEEAMRLSSGRPRR